MAALSNGFKCELLEISSIIPTLEFKIALSNPCGSIIFPTTLQKLFVTEYSCAVTPQVRQTGNRLSGLAGTAYASLLT